MGKMQDGKRSKLSVTRRSLSIALLRAREQVMERFRPMLRKHGVSEQQWRVLRVLEESPGIDMGELADAACLLAPSLSRMTKALEVRGLIESARDTRDGRRARLRLTRSGTALIREVTPESAAIYAGIEAQVGSDRIESLLDQLDALLHELEGPDS